MKEIYSCKIKNFFNKGYKHKSAFSMIELSVVILIIGVLIGGTLASQRIIAKFRINTAQMLTISSPVNGIADSTIWLESSLEKSFKDSESSDTNNLSAWYDIRENVNKNNAVQTDSSHAPTYSNTINYIHAVKFDGTNGYLTIPDASFLNNSSYTIFVLEKRESNKSSNYFIGDSTSGNESTTNRNITLGYSADGTIKHSQSSDNSYTSSITTYAASSDKPRTFAFVHDKTSGKKTYINGLLAATSSNTENLTGITSLRIGSGYQGQIGEIIMFGRAITTEERQSVEDYLGKKWTSPILRTVGNSALGASCTGGTVSNTGCQLTCTVPATTGITETTVADGSGALTCDTGSHFTGTLPYNCSNGVFTASGSCGCALGYSPSGSTCVANTCTFSGTTGVTDGTIVNVGTGSQACGSGYAGSISYTCTSNGGAPTINSGSCYLQCSGGIINTYSSSGTIYTFHTFNSSGTITCPAAKTVSALVVAGGGGGGAGWNRNQGLGGGAGGVLYNASLSILATSYPITVGDGGASGYNGSNSVFSTMTAIGGGGGQNGTSGGSGGAGTYSGGTGTSGQGNAGGFDSQYGYAHGGGGGAGAVGASGVNSPAKGGNGGDGIQNSITGTPTYYGGGGGGGIYHYNTCSPTFVNSVAVDVGNCNIGTGGLGGGGSCGQAGTDNTGGGGGGGIYQNLSGFKGGSGVVIVSYSN